MSSINQLETLRTRPELLSPAGSWDCLLAAVTNGADAVYLGTQEFNARVHARNFSFEELDQAIKYCHKHGVRIYLTMNTLVKNNEIKRFFNTLYNSYTLDIDGVIIQHISFLEIIKNNFPGLKVFISTQAGIGNTSSTSLLKSADRIILPRELSLEEVRKITNSGISAEVFVHGALCFSYSGLCLFSSFVSNRSGNRGYCAQLCRQKYNSSYLLSTKELCLARRIPELIQAGITGFKIEGRMRSPLYVAVATRLYRKAIDSFLAGKFEVSQKEMAEIEVVFNREFTEGFTFGETSLISSEKPMNRGAFLGIVGNGDVVLRRPVAIGDGIGIWGENNVTGAIIKEIIIADKKVSSANAGDKVRLGLGAKEGSRIYLTSSTQISNKPGFAIKRPSILPLKRKKVKVVLPQITPRRAPTLKLLAKVYSVAEGRETAQAGASVIFYNIFYPDFPEKKDWQEKTCLGAYLPRIMNDAQLSSAIDLLAKRNPEAVLTGNLGFLSRRAEFDIPTYLDYTFNSFNEMDLLFFEKFNVIPILSPELSINEMTEFLNKNVVIFCHGDVVLANTLISLKDKDLVDEKGFSFRVRKENSYWQILNSRPFGMFNDIRKLHMAGFNQFLIDKQGENARFTTFYRNLLKKDIADRRIRKGYTSGHLYRPVS